MRIALFEFASATARFRLVRRQRQDKYRVWYSVKPLVVARVHEAERFPADELLTRLPVEIVRPRAGYFCDVNFKTTRPCQEMPTRPFLKGSFFVKGLFFVMNHR